MPAGFPIQGSAWGATRLRTRVWARWPRAEGCPMAPMAMRSASGRGWSLSRSESETQRTDIWSGYRLPGRMHRIFCPGSRFLFHRYTKTPGAVGSAPGVQVGWSYLWK